MTRPVYVHDLAALASDARSIRSVLPDRVELLYAVKANPDRGVLETLAPVVDGFEAASRGELRRLAEVLPGRSPAAFAGPGKTDEDLTAALAAGVRRIHVESPAELDRLAAIARSAGRSADVLLRVNLPVAAPGASLVMGGGPSPFGMEPAEAVCCARRPPTGIRVRGVHAHLASGLDAPWPARSPPRWSSGRSARSGPRRSTSVAAWRWTTPARGRGSTGPGTAVPSPGSSPSIPGCGCASSLAGR
ncbi:hypothetical protein GCM10027614_19070 [Micromonospora vulcania]